MDSIGALFKKGNRGSTKPRHCIARYLVVKHSWRGSYKRLLCITPDYIFTQDPAQNFRITNSYSIGPDADIDGLNIGPGPDEFSILARSDKKSRKFSAVKFSCKQRASLLTDLYQCIVAVTALSNAGLAFKLLSSAETFSGSMWSIKRGCWVPVILQLSAFEFTCLQPGTGDALWRVHYLRLCNPAFSLLANSTAPAPAASQDIMAGAATDDTGVAHPPPHQVVAGVVAVHAAGRRRPKLLSCGVARDAILGVIRSQASKRLGLELNVDSTLGHVTGEVLLQAVSHADMQAASQLCEHPLAEWEVSKLRPRHDVQPALACLPTPHLLARPLGSAAGHHTMQDAGGLSGGGANLSTRRLVLTATHLVERHVGSYSLASSRPLAAVAALVRCAEDPQLLALEWSDGMPASMFLSTTRDAVLAAILDATQASCGTPIPVFPGLTAPCDDVAGVVATPPHPAPLPPHIHPPLHATTAGMAHANGGPTSQAGAMGLAGLHTSLVMPTKVSHLMSNKVTPGGGGSAEVQAAREVVRWACDELVGRARDVFPVLNTSGRNFFTADIEFAPPPAHPPPSPSASHPTSDLSPAPSTFEPSPHTPSMSAPSASAVVGAADGMSESGGGATAPGTGTAPPDATTPAAIGTAGGLTSAGSTAADVLARGSVPLSTATPVAGARLSLFGNGFNEGGRAATESGPVREAVEILMESVVEFCALVPPAGVPPFFRLDAQAASCLLAMLPPELQPGLLTPPHLPADDVKQAVLVLQCLQRLSASHQAAHTLLTAPGAIGRLFAALSCSHEHVSYEASKLLLRCVSPHTARMGAVPWRAVRGGLALLGSVPGAATAEDLADAALHSTLEDLDLAKTAKAMCFTHSLLASRVAQVLAPLRRERPACSPLLSITAVELVAAVACEPGSATTDSKLMTTFLTECAALGRPLFELFHHPAARVADGVAVLMRAIAESGTGAAMPMREAALKEGAVLHHLLLAVAPAPGPRTRLSQDLVASWADEYAPALTLLRRILPLGLIRHLNIPKHPRPSIPAVPPAPVPGAALVPGAAVQQPAGFGASEHQGGQAAADAPYGQPTGMPSTPTQPQAVQAVQAVHPVQAIASSPPPPGLGLSATLSGSGDSSASAAATTGAQVGVSNQPPATSASGAAGLSNGTAAGTAGATPAPDSSTSTAGATSTAINPLAPPQSTPPAPTPAPAPVQAAMAVLVSGGLRGNWDALWRAVSRDHCHAGLVWNEACRRELREALQAEEAQLRARRRQVAFQATSVPPTWNHEEFRVTYPSLTKHICIGGIYVRLLLDGADTAAVSKVPSPRDLFQALQHHMLCSDSHLLHAHASSLSSLDEKQRHASLQSSALSEVESVQLLCVRAMTEVYHAHAGVVGPIEGLPHLLRILDLSLRRPLRHHLLLFVAAALQPRAATTSMQAQKAAKTNAVCLCDEGGVELLVDMAASAHEATDESLAAITGAAAGSHTAPATPAAQAAAASAPTHYLTSTGHQAGPKEWYYYPTGVTKAEGGVTKVVDSGADDTAGHARQAVDPDSEQARAPDATGRVGPISKAELLQLWREGQVYGHTLCWAEGCAAPTPLAGIRELRWLVSGGPPVMSVKEAARTSLQLLVALAHMQPATDDTGSVLQPLPRVLRILATPRCLSHISQLVLTRDPQLVAQACGLLQRALVHNEDVLARLYRTGLFYFVLSYAGSNLGEVAALLAASHLKQAHRGAAHTPAPGAPLAARSYLGHLLPESLLYCLDTYGHEAFATALCGDSDTPELRWTHSMRWGRLIPQLTAHIGDLPHRLAQNWGGVLWSYTPAPPITYPDLKDELWCHRYYLRALCDEVAFPDWAILDHVQLLQALLAEWRAELARTPLSLSEADACQVLGLERTGGVVSEEDMRRAYRSLARKYHPDKNPAGRAMFLKVQQAYERLQAGAAGGQGPQAWRLQLIIKAQCILFRRCKALLAPYKYAGYPMLLDVLSQLKAQATAAVSTTGKQGATDTPAGAAAIKDQNELTQAACELCWRTVCTSHLNADELGRCGGVSIICSLFQHMCATRALTPDISPTSHEAVVGAHLLRSIAGFAASETARQQLAGVAGLPADLLRCCTLTRAHAAAEAALVAVGHLCGTASLQDALMQSDAYAHLIPMLFWYDNTISETPGSTTILPFTMQPLPTAAPQPSPSPAPPPAQAPSPAGPVPPQPSPTSNMVSSPIAHSLGVLESPLVRGSEGKAHNFRAMLAAQVVARLAGVLAPPFNTPAYVPAQQALGVLLTHGLAVKLREADPRHLLTLLNSGQESAQVIWNAAMRDELLILLSNIRDGTHSSTVSHIDGSQSGVTSDSGSATERLLSWRYSSLKDELQVGGVWVRVFCANPTTLPQDVPGFCKALVRYLYEVFVTSASSPTDNPKHPSQLLTAVHSHGLSDVLRVLSALGLLVDAEPRLLGLLSSRSAVSPLVACLQVAAAHAFATAQSTGKTAAAPTGESDTVTATSPTAATATAAVEPAGGAPATLTGSSAAAGSADSSAAESPAAELAQAALLVMSKLVCHAGCMEALSDVNTLRLLFHVVHCAPSALALRQALGVLRALAGQPAAGVAAADQAGALFLLALLLHPPGAPWPWQGGDMPGGLTAEESVAQEVTGLLSKLMASPTHGTAITMQLQRLLPPALVSTLASSPPAVVLSALRSRVVNPELVWDQQMAGQAAAQVTVLAHQARMQQAEFSSSPVWQLPAGFSSTYQQLQGELRVGGVYCRLFLKDPQYPLKEPLKFGEGLAEALVAALTTPTASSRPPGDEGGLEGSDLVVLLSACAVALLKHHLLVADTLTTQGYVPRLLALLAARLPPAPTPPEPAAQQPQRVVDEGGALLRLLHALAESSSACEALATASTGLPPGGAVGVLSGARVWGHTAEVLVLETLKRSLGRSNRSRDALVHQAIQVGLVPSLLARLDWQQETQGASTDSEGSDVSVLRALAVDVLTELRADGAYGQQVAALLDASPIWSAYKEQRHDLYLPAGAAAAGSVAGLLTGPTTQQFALPAPERLSSAGAG